MDHSRSDYMRETDLLSEPDDDISPEGNVNDKDQEQIDKERYARESHCEIERRRRNKMTSYISELCDMVPTCSSLARKPDKLTILRMAVTHMKTLRGTGNTGVDGPFKPSFLSDQELKHLILEAADGFLFACQCEDGRIVYVSDSVTSVLNQSQSDWYQHSLYELCHPEDGEKIREQLCPPQSHSSPSNHHVLSPYHQLNGHHHHQQHPPHDSLLNTQQQSSSSPTQSSNTNNNTNSTTLNCPLPPPSRVLDLKTGTVKKEGHQSQIRACVSARRGFICRMRLGHANNMDQSPAASRTMRIRQRNTINQTADGHQYALVHVTGIIKSWLPQNQHSTQNSNNPASGLNPLDVSSTGDSTNSSVPNNGTSTSTQCLVGLGRLQVTSVLNTSDLSPHRQNEFVTRHSQDLKLTFCDQRVSMVLGYNSNDLLDKSLLDLIHPDDHLGVQESFEQAWKLKGQIITIMVRMRHINGDYITISCNMFAFLNPYSEEVEYVIITNSSTKGIHQRNISSTSSLFSNILPGAPNNVMAPDNNGLLATNNTTNSFSEQLQSNNATNNGNGLLGPPAPPLQPNAAVSMPTTSPTNPYTTTQPYHQSDSSTNSNSAIGAGAAVGRPSAICYLPAVTSSSTSTTAPYVPPDYITQAPAQYYDTSTNTNNTTPWQQHHTTSTTSNTTSPTTTTTPYNTPYGVHQAPPQFPIVQQTPNNTITPPTTSTTPLDHTPFHQQLFPHNMYNNTTGGGVGNTQSADFTLNTLFQAPPNSTQNTLLDNNHPYNHANFIYNTIYRYDDVNNLSTAANGL